MSDPAPPSSQDEPQAAHAPDTHVDRRYTCGACLQSYCAVCQRPACPHPAWEKASAPTVDVAALRAVAEACWDAIQKARYTAPDTTAPWGFWAAARQTYQLAVDDPRVVLALLDRLAALEAALEELREGLGVSMSAVDAHVAIDAVLGREKASRE